MPGQSGNSSELPNAHGAMPFKRSRGASKITSPLPLGIEQPKAGQKEASNPGANELLSSEARDKRPWPFGDPQGSVKQPTHSRPQPLSNPNCNTSHQAVSNNQSEDTLVLSKHVPHLTTMDCLPSQPTISSPVHNSNLMQSTIVTGDNMWNLAHTSDLSHQGDHKSGLGFGLTCSPEYTSSHTLSTHTLDHESNASAPRPDDEYGCDEIFEEDLLHMVDMLDSQDYGQLVPSSVLETWDHDSRSAKEYDPNLQHSPQPASEAKYSQPAAEISTPLQETEDLLDEDVDWDAVYSMTKDMVKDPSLVISSKKCHSKLPMDHTLRFVKPFGDLQVENSASIPFERSLFPRRVGNESVIPTASGKTFLRTFFRIDQLIGAAGENAVFEFYARVMYSARETMAQRQHFQFADILEDQHPYPSGTLTGWRTGSSLDRQSYVFISSREIKLCRCIGTMRRDQKTSCGWVIEIMRIHEISWEEIHIAESTICGTSGQAENGKRNGAENLRGVFL